MTIDNTQDHIDSRDVVARIKELEAERESLVDAVNEAAEAKEKAQEDGADEDDMHDLHMSHKEAYSELAQWDTSDEAEELRVLKALADEAEGSPDWQYGETLIRDSYFQEYAQQLAEDIGAIDPKAGWPLHCIDWEQAANELKHDYFCVDFDGVEYWVRA